MIVRRLGEMYEVTIAHVARREVCRIEVSTQKFIVPGAREGPYDLRGPNPVS